MQAMIDHTAAVIIGGSILFILAALSLRSQASTIEATQVDLAKTELRSLIDLVEQDFNNMGSGMTYPNENTPNRVIRTFGTASGYTAMSFYSLEDPIGLPDTVLVTYRWRQQGSVTLPDGTSTEAYEVQREVGSTTARFEKVTAFSIDLTRKDFTPIPLEATDLEEARYIDIEIAMVSPVGVEALLEQTRWSKQFRPMNLNPEAIHVVEASCVPSC